MGNLTPQKFESGIDASAEEKISQLLSAMPRIDAPGDFGFRVKARIADRNSARGTFVWMPTAVKAAVPLGLAVFVGGYFAVTSFYVTDDAAPSQAAVETVRPGIVQLIPAAPASESASLPEVIALAPKETKSDLPAPVREVAIKTRAKRPLARKPAVDDSRGSYVIAASNTVNPSTDGEKPVVVKPEEIKGTPAGEVLTRIGVNALFGENGWKADSVSPNTAAAKAGVQAGDIIESVDDQDMTERGSVAKPAKGKKLKVKRDGKSVEIVID